MASLTSGLFFPLPLCFTRFGCENSLKPFFSLHLLHFIAYFLGMSLRYLILPVPVVLLLIAFLPQLSIKYNMVWLHLLKWASGYPQAEHLFLCLWYAISPHLRQKVAFFFLLSPWEVVPFYCIKQRGRTVISFLYNINN